MQSMIFAAGKGTRLKPLTDILPKALVPVADKPLLQHVLDRMSEAGADRVVVNVHHHARQIVNFVQLAQPSYRFPISISDESSLLLETGGAIKKARPLFVGQDGSIEPVLIHNCDILSNVCLKDFYRQACLKGDAALLVSQRKTSRYLVFSNDDMRLLGWTNVDTGEVKSPHADLKERIEQGRAQLLAFSGIHVIGPTLLARMDEEPDVFPIIDFYLRHCATARIQGITLPGMRLLDVGKLNTLAEAEQFLEEI